MRKSHAVAVIAGLLLALLVPAAQVGAQVDVPDVECPAGFELNGDACERTTIRSFFPAQVATLTCPAGFVGPDDGGECTSSGDEVFAATPEVELVCPEGFAGPDVGGACARDVVEPDPDAAVEFFCTADAVLVEAGGEGFCERQALVLTEQAPSSVRRISSGPAMLVNARRLWSTPHRPSLPVAALAAPRASRCLAMTAIAR